MVLFFPYCNAIQFTDRLDSDRAEEVKMWRAVRENKVDALSTAWQSLRRSLAT